MVVFKLLYNYIELKKPTLKYSPNILISGIHLDLMCIIRDKVYETQELC